MTNISQLSAAHAAKIVISGLLLGVSLSYAPSAIAQGPPHEPKTKPFIVYSDAPGLQASLPVRRRFPGKFTANLTLGQAHALARQGLRIEPVRLFHITKPNHPCDPWPSCRNDGGNGGEDRFATPDEPTPWGIDMVTPNSGVTSGGDGVNVAVLDTGIDKNHLDLERRVIGCVDFTVKKRGGGIEVGKCDDNHGHGSHVAGTIAGDGGQDGLGIYGVAPAADLLIYKVCSNNGCWGDDIAAAIDYAGSNGADIVSMSLGGDQESPLTRAAIERNDTTLFVAAAGNDGPAEGSIDYPAANPMVIAVGAIDSDEKVPDWSSLGVNNGDGVIESREVELAAPGVSVESTWKDGTYRYMSGTSMATPHVSGLAAKVWSGNAASARGYLQSLAKDIWDPGIDEATGFGLATFP